MNKNLKRLMKEADYPAPEIAQRAQLLAELVVKECMDVVAKKCASPTAYQALVEHWNVEL